MDLRVIEGLWEDVLRHAPELEGRKVRVTVLEELAAPARFDRALEDLIARAEALAQPPDEPTPTPEDWGEAIAEKYRRQGFDL